MTPEAQTLYSVFLFFALVALLGWANRRHRVSQRFCETVAAPPVKPSSGLKLVRAAS
ncbi:MAG TPA: hypothetical protein VKU19_41970 [Bryobacteraceae bacterium]|nr:hypothetical protein [Bryobacteraceae bacterium]